MSDAGINSGISLLADSIAISNFYAYVSCWHLNEHESAAMWKLYCTSSESLVIKTDVKSLKQSLNELADHNFIFSKINYDSSLSKYKKIDLTEVNAFNAFNVLLMKRESFEHEREYRVLLISNDDRLEVLKENYIRQKLKIEKWYKDQNDDMNKMEKSLKEDVISQGEFHEYIKKVSKEEFSYINEELNDRLIQIGKEKDIVKKIIIDPNVLIKEIIISPYSPSWFVQTIQKLIRDLGYDFKVSQSKLYELN